MRLWIAGDSLVITPGYAVYRALGQNEAVEKIGDVEGRVATGLTRPDVFNWFKHVSEQVQRRRVDTVVFCFGGNDDHDLMTGLPDGVSLEVRRAEVDEGIPAPGRRAHGHRQPGRRVRRLARAAGHRRRRALPPLEGCSTRWLSPRRRSARARSPTWTCTACSRNGGFASYLENKEGELEKVRAPDGIHLERGGRRGGEGAPAPRGLRRLELEVPIASRPC